MHRTSTIKLRRRRPQIGNFIDQTSFLNPEDFIFSVHSVLYKIVRTSTDKSVWRTMPLCHGRANHCSNATEPHVWLCIVMLAICFVATCCYSDSINKQIYVYTFLLHSSMSIHTFRPSIYSIHFYYKCYYPFTVSSRITFLQFYCTCPQFLLSLLSYFLHLLHLTKFTPLILCNGCV